MHPGNRTSMLEEVKRDGFAVLEKYLSETDVEALLHATHSSNCQNGADPSIRLKRGVAFARRNLLDVPAVRAFASSSFVRDLLRDIGPDFVPIRAILFDKTGEANWTVPWHQDRSIAVRDRLDVPGFGPWSVKSGIVHVQPPLELLQDLITLRFSLDACGPDNGPLRVVPGTHLSLLDPKELEEVRDQRRQVTCTTDAGGVVIMRPLLLHALSPARASTHRRILHIEFGPRELPAGLQWAFHPFEHVVPS